MAPSGNRLDNSFATLISFSLDPTIGLWELGIKPPGGQRGNIDTTTGRNVTFRTKIFKKLLELTEGSIRVAYDEGHYNRIMAMVGKNQQITISWPTGRPMSFWGGLDAFAPDELSDDDEKRPMASIKITPTMQDNSGAEQGITLGTTTTSTTTTTTT